jgi:hypothetical protein
VDVRIIKRQQDSVGVSTTDTDDFVNAGLQQELPARGGVISITGFFPRHLGGQFSLNLLNGFLGRIYLIRIDD